MGPEVAAAGGAGGAAVARQARHRLRERHRRAAASPPRARPEAGRRGHRARLHLLRDRGRHPQRRRHAGLRRHRPGTFNVDPAAIEAAITPRTRAIVLVHLFGQMAPMERILPLAQQARPDAHRGRRAGDRRARGRWTAQWRVAGELGTVGTFSFFPSKNLGAWGDGGMMVTQDEALADRLRRLRLHGGARQYHHDEVGLQQPPRFAPGGGAAGQAAAPGGVERARGGHAPRCTPRPSPASRA